MKNRLVVIGGTAAGLSAASKAKRNQPQLEVAVFEKSGYVSYGSCGLPYYVGGIIPDVEDLISLTATQLSEKRGINTYIHHEVISINRESKTVIVRDIKNKREFPQPYDYLVIATGAKAFVPDVKGIDASGVHFLRCIEDGIALRQAIEQGVRSAVVIGGGLIGLETAEQLSLNGINVSVIETAPKLLGFLNDSYAEMVGNTLKSNQIDLRLATTVVEIITENNIVTGVKTAKGEIIQTEMVLVSVGASPNTSLAKDCGIDLGLRGGIIVDKTMATSDPSIWACGDCVQMYNILTGAACYFPLGTTANKQGRVAGDNISGSYSEFSGVLGSQITKVFDLYVGSTGLTIQQAKDAGFDAVSCSIIKSDRASYYPGGIDNHITLIFDCKDGRLLGAQGIGSVSISGRINVLVAAITAGMTIEQLNELDLVYTPSVAPVYDPILIAASQGVKLLKQR